ncbi:MAG TPA: hypothetical protein VK871_05810 [Candidatus Limnocylindrales bacterium]|nr:hypothetical protein [Candidatus Limnocylindrales bacterium]
MLKRSVAAVLWFFTVAWAWNYVAALTGLPSATGLVLAVAVAAFVAVDPKHLFWPAALRPTAELTPMPSAGVGDALHRPL